MQQRVRVQPPDKRAWPCLYYVERGHTAVRLRERALHDHDDSQDRQSRAHNILWRVALIGLHVGVAYGDAPEG